MTDENDFEQNDEQMERLLRPLDEDAAPVDQDVMRAAILAATAKYQDTHSGIAAENKPTTVTIVDTTPKKAKPMFAFTKSITVLVASAVMLVTALMLPPGRAVGDLTFGDVLNLSLIHI